MKIQHTQARMALRLATSTVPLIVRALVKAAHGKASERGQQLLVARRLTAELLAKIDVAGDAADAVEDDAA